MNTPITNDQIIAMNTVLADHIVQTSELSDQDTRLEQFISKATPQKVIDLARKVAQDNELHFNVIDTVNFPDFILITTWRYDYRSIHLQW